MVSLSDKGLKLIYRMVPLRVQNEASLLTVLSTLEQVILSQLLSKLQSL